MCIRDRFQDVLRNGENSKYRDFFIDWNKFWEGHGTMTAEGYIRPDEDLIRDMFFRKPGLPILMVRLPDGKKVPYWNTFYQEVRYPPVDAWDLMGAMDIQYLSAQLLAERINDALDKGKKPEELSLGKFEEYRQHVIGLLESRCRYLGQMDLNIRSPLVWEFYDDTLRTPVSYTHLSIRRGTAWVPSACWIRKMAGCSRETPAVRDMYCCIWITQPQ